MPLAVAALAHPSWLYEELISGTLPWRRAQPYTYNQFTERYTLHDSQWVGLFPDIAYPGNTVICLHWDTLWLPEAIATRLHPGSSLYLLIKITGTSGITFGDGRRSDFQNSSSANGRSPESSTLPRKVACTELVELEENRVLLMTDTEGQSVTLIFEGTLSFLAIDTQQRLIPL